MHPYVYLNYLYLYSYIFNVKKYIYITYLIFFISSTIYLLSLTSPKWILFPLQCDKYTEAEVDEAGCWCP